MPAPLAAASFRCYNASQHMADWKQITARIRRARSGKDPAGQLAALFEKTRDAMVAFELARFFETSGQNSDAAKWYVAAAERFRRGDWKAKAQEAALRLGAEVSAASAQSSVDAPQAPGAEAVPEPALEQPSLDTSASDSSDDPSQSQESAEVPVAESAEAGEKKHRRRGRRGGRNRRRGQEHSSSTHASSSRSSAAPAKAENALPAAAVAVPQLDSSRSSHPRAIPTLPMEPGSESSAPGARGRSGDPGLSSRLSALEMQLRRLLTCPPAKLGDADHAPAGPGVLVLTDSDLTSYYYVEACQTLRIAVANLLRGGSTRRGADSIKPRLAEHLGIPETRVAKYLADHCVVRWLQMDEGASYFAHFVVAVIRPVLNE